jgi:6-phosphogluconolactonase (cycloisomerase 2 family)
MAALYPAFKAAAGQKKKQLAYVGTYNTSSDGAGGNGKGIYLAEMNTASGELNVLGLAASTENASWLSFDPSGRFLYAANEVANFNGKNGAVSAYAVDRSSGKLELLNAVSSEGAGPAHLSVDATGKYVFVANYAGGTVAVIAVRPDGGLGEPTYTHQDTGSLGPIKATSAPPGSFAISGHDKPHCHMILADPSNRYVLYSDLAQDRIYVSAFDGKGKLTPLSYASVPPGDGPRHFTFHKNGRWLYALQEEGSTVMFFHFDPATGALKAEQTLSTLPPGFAGTNFTSEIVLSPDGKFLYAANRLHDSVAVFAVGADGHLQYKGETSTMGSYPRYIQIAPGGAFLYACNQRSDSMATFRIHRETGMPAFTGNYTGIGSPACIVFFP